MEDMKTELPWEDLGHAQGGIPWPALFRFAAAAVSNESLTNDLVELYERACESGFDRPHYEDFYVPAIFTLAAPRLNDDRRRQIGNFLIQKLVEAGQDDAGLSMEVLMAACGSMGPAILPAVLDAIENEPDRDGAWFYLWGLTGLAAGTEDVNIRNSVIKACTDLLRQADRGNIEPMDAVEAAWTLAHLKCSDSIGLLRRLKSKAPNVLGYGDYAEALDLLQGRSDQHLSPRSWEIPVSQWLGSNWRTARDWHAEQGHECGPDKTETASRRARELAGRFLESSEAAKLGADLLEDAKFIAANVLEYAWEYLSSDPEHLDESILGEVLLRLLPSKLAGDRELFEKVAPVTAALLEWLEAEGILPHTAGLIETVHGWADAIVAESMDPGRWGIEKRLAMQARAEGVDITDEEAMEAFVANYYRVLSDEDSSDRGDLVNFAPKMPIVELSPKIGRNQPCPCGSGRKYKKCCGGVKKTDVHN